MAISVTVNGQPRTLDLDPDTPLLWALRDTLGLTGTKFGCGIAACGACTVHVDGQPMRSCSVPVVAVEGASITTIEGLAPEGSLHPVQQAWIDHQVPQCGYCQSGMIMAVSALLASQPHPTDPQVDEAITNICRCGTFARVRRAIQALAPPEAGPGDAALARRSHSTHARRSEAEPR
jgi:isoquinoline 1-oxidoreductase alpha subunit